MGFVWHKEIQMGAQMLKTSVTLGCLALWPHPGIRLLLSCTVWMWTLLAYYQCTYYAMYYTNLRWIIVWWHNDTYRTLHFCSLATICIIITHVGIFYKIVIQRLPVMRAGNQNGIFMLNVFQKKNIYTCIYNYNLWSWHVYQ